MVRVITCVAIAGALFISAIYYDYKLLFIIAAFLTGYFYPLIG